MSICFHIFTHEIKKILNDKKLLISMFIMPIILVFLLSFLSAATENSKTTIPTAYILNNALEESNRDFKIVPVDYVSLEELQNSKKLESSDVVIDIQDDNISIYYNDADSNSYNLAVACEQVFYNNIAYEYSTSIKTLNVVTHDLNSTMNMNNIFIATMLPYMLVLLLFQNTANFATDTIAGEKERGVFGKTLLTPVKPMPVIIGKILSSAICGLISCVIYFGVVSVVTRITGQDTLGLKDANLTGGMIASIFLTATILCYFVATLVVLYSLRGKTVKEAQNSNRIVFVLVTVAAMMSMFRTGSLSYSHYFIPVYNICIVMQDILYSSVNGWNVLSMIGSLLGCSLVVSGLTVFIFKKEAVNY